MKYKKKEEKSRSYSQCGSINRNQLCYIVIEQKKKIQFIELCVSAGQLKSQHTNFNERIKFIAHILVSEESERKSNNFISFY